MFDPRFFPCEFKVHAKLCIAVFLFFFTLPTIRPREKENIRGEKKREKKKREKKKGGEKKKKKKRKKHLLFFFIIIIDK